ncbi:MAG: bifunctional methylenetetrahydrofolate dehydrogenase/methenyltetrahydrofolate cyclohydrolase FolD [Rhodothermales bacterium]
MAHLIDGRAIAAQVRAEVRAAVDTWTRQGHRAPYLAVVLVGDHPASASYVRGKMKACGEAGIDSDTLAYDAGLSEAELLHLIDRLNDDHGVDGILVQLPLPDHIDEQKVIRAIDPDKDVDGFHPENAGRLMIGQPGFVPATPTGIMELLRRSGIETQGRHAVIIGRSNIVGKPLASLLMRRGTDATVTVCHSKTRDLPALTRQADILVAAIGRAQFVTAEMVKQGAAVIDVGINRVEDATRERGYRLVGDVDFEAVAEKAGWITPVPGGVGPMTIAMLLRNTLTAAQHLTALGQEARANGEW